MQHDLTHGQMAEAVAHLARFVSDHKKARIEEVLTRRTRRLTIVLENVYQPHNASAVIRTCDCFGIQDLHVIETATGFSPSADITVGSEKWVDIHRHRGSVGDEAATRTCLEGLKRRGYRIAALTLREPGSSIRALPIDRPLALCIGAEEHGLSEAAHELADEFVRVPMLGFTQSFNLSVTAAVALYELRTRLDESPAPWGLSDPERLALTFDWYVKTVPRARDHLRVLFHDVGGSEARV